MCVSQTYDQEGEEKMENARCSSDLKEMGMCKH
jgi:hypothetical protein